MKNKPIYPTVLAEGEVLNEPPCPHLSAHIMLHYELPKEVSVIVILRGAKCSVGIYQKPSSNRYAARQQGTGCYRHSIPDR